jgi:hypothetical protein
MNNTGKNFIDDLIFFSLRFIIDSPKHSDVMRVFHGALVYYAPKLSKKTLDHLRLNITSHLCIYNGYDYNLNLFWNFVELIDEQLKKFENE